MEPKPPLSAADAGTHAGTNAAYGELPEVYQAAGVVMAQLDVDITTADKLLRSYAHAAHRPLVDVARNMLVDQLALIELPTS